jgi:hypothetical protein
MPWPVIRLVAAVVLATCWRPPAAQAAPARGCADTNGIRHRLQLSGTDWQIACKAEAGALSIAALMPASPKSPPKLVAAVAAPGGELHHGSVDVASPDDKRVAEAGSAAENWTINVGRIRLGGEPLLRVALTAHWGGNLLSTYQIVAFFRPAREALVPLWLGVGDWQEDRFQICLVKARAAFTLRRGAGGQRTLERITRLQVRKGPAPADDEPSRQVQKECVLPPTERRAFRVTS